MDNLEDLESKADEVLGKLRSHRLFQSTWDMAAFIILLLFLGTMFLLLLPPLLHCCCYCCYPSSRSQKVGPKQVNSVGVKNLALEP